MHLPDLLFYRQASAVCGVVPKVVGVPCAVQEQRMRSTSLQFDIAAGPVSSGMLQAAGADQEQLTISNSKDPAARRLLRNAVVQLYDSHNNSASVAGVLSRWRLYCTDSGSVRAGAEVPQLCVATGELQLQSNDKGRAFFGDVGVEEGTGKMVSDNNTAVDMGSLTGDVDSCLHQSGS